jgi:hypothetical protein
METKEIRPAEIRPAEKTPIILGGGISMHGNPSIPSTPEMVDRYLDVTLSPNNSGFKPMPSAPKLNKGGVLPFIEQAQTGKVQTEQAKTEKRIPRNSQICTVLYLESRFPGLLNFYASLVDKNTTSERSREDNYDKVHTAIIEQDRSRFKLPSMMLHTIFTPSKSPSFMRAVSEYLSILKEDKTQPYNEDDLALRIIETDNLAVFSANEIVKILRNLDENTKISPVIVNSAVSKIPAVLDLKLRDMDPEKRAKYSDEFFNQMARLLHTMPDELIYLDPEVRTQLFRHYDENIAYYRMPELQHHYTKKFQNSSKEGYDSIKKVWEQVNKYLVQFSSNPEFDFLSDEDFLSGYESFLSQLDLQLQGEDSTYKDATFVEQYIYSAFQFLIEAAVTMPEENRSFILRELKRFIRYLLEKIPKFYPLMDRPFKSDTRATQEVLQVPHSMDDAQEFDALKPEVDLAVYMIRPNLLLALDSAKRLPVLEKMFEKLSKEEGRQYIEAVLQNKLTPEQEQLFREILVNGEQPVTKIFEKDKQIKTPYFGKLIVMALLNQTSELIKQFVDSESDDTHTQEKLTQRITDILEKAPINIGSGVNPFPGDAFYWVVNTLWETIVNLQSSLASLDKESKTAHLNDELKAAKALLKHLFADHPASNTTTSLNIIV